MDLSAGNISALVFKPVIKGDLGNFSIDGHMLSVLMALDGKLTLEEVVQKTGLNMATLREAAVKLTKINLISLVNKPLNTVDQEFMDYLVAELSMAIGPLAEVILEDGLEELGHTIQHFPVNRIAELINLLSQEIQRDEKKAEFKQNMVKKIKEKGY